MIGKAAVSDYALTTLLVLEGLTLFVAAPLAGMGFRFPLLIGGILGIPLALTIVLISPSLGGRLLALLSAALVVGGAVFRIGHPSIESIWLGHVAIISALLAISLVIGQAVFAPGRVTHHRIEGAIIIFLNIAMIFTSAYRMISELDPAAFANVPAAQTEAAAVSGMLYFSFTTLTSTGFGDIVPLHPIARSLSNLEAVLGQLYLTILLARLVTLHVAGRRE
jgi:Ion channel